MSFFGVFLLLVFLQSVRVGGVMVFFPVVVQTKKKFFSRLKNQLDRI